MCRCINFISILFIFFYFFREEKIKKTESQRKDRVKNGRGIIKNLNSEMIKYSLKNKSGENKILCDDKKGKDGSVMCCLGMKGLVIQILNRGEGWNNGSVFKAR